MRTMLAVAVWGWAVVAAAQEPPPAVAVTGTGEVEVPPARATVDLAVETQAKTAEAAAKEAARRIDAVGQALRKLDVPAAAVRTVQYELFPEYRHEERPELPPREVLVGYRAVQTLQVDVAALPRLGAVIDAAIAAGANRVAQLQLEPADPAAARREALKRAVSAARADAEAIAAAAGQRVGAPLSLSAGNGPVMPFRADIAMAEMRMAKTATQIPSGPLTVTATVNAVFRLEPGRQAP